MEELPSCDVEDMITDEHIRGSQFVLENTERLTVQCAKTFRWLVNDPLGELLITQVKDTQKIFAHKRAKEIGITPGKFLISAYRRLHDDVSIALFHASLTNNPHELARGLFFESGGLGALETVSILRRQEACQNAHGGRGRPSRKRVRR